MKNLKIRKIMNHRNIVKKRFILILLVTLLSSSLIASETTSTFSLTAISNTTILLQLPGSIDSTLTISLYDVKGSTIHQEELKGGTIERKYDLKKLTSGEYIFEISFNQTKKWKHIQIEAGILQIIEEDFQMIIEPSIKLNDGYLDLNLLCFSDSKVNLSIWDKDGHLLWEEYIDANGSIGKRYNLTNLQEGEYQLDISITDPSIQFDFSKRIELKSQETNKPYSNEIALNKKSLQ